METRLQKTERHSELLNSVFSNELLLDTILDYAIHDGSNALISNACSFRLVSRNWHRSISRIMLSSREPLFQMRLHDNVSICGKRRSETLLQEFQNMVVGKGHLNERVPPFSIMADCQSTLFIKKDCQELLTFLENYGTGLVELDVTFPKQFQWKPLPSSTTLPKLGLLRVDVREISEEVVTPQDKAEFIQSMLNTSEQLKSFSFYGFTSIAGMNFGEYNFTNLVFPSSITNVTLYCTLNENNLGGLAKNPLPNLRNLKLRGSKHDGIISSILENVKKTLKVLSLEVVLRFDNESWIRNPSSLSFKLPLMEKLETLIVGNMHPMEQYLPLQQMVPMLTHLALTPIYLENWTEKPLESVVSLYMMSDFFTALEGSDIDILHNAFPNLEKLEIDLDGEYYLECVQMIWRKFGRIKVLKITVVGVMRQVTNANAWDALLIGIPKNSVMKLRKAPELWEEIQKTSDDVSIRNLTDLQTLQLRAYNVKMKPLISDAAFQFAFLRMPNLSKLVLQKGFSATQEMKEQWEKEGRTIEIDE